MKLVASDITCFPAISVGCMLAHACHRLHVFPAVSVSQDRVVRKAFNANLGLKVNRGINFSSQVQN